MSRRTAPTLAALTLLALGCWSLTRVRPDVGDARRDVGGARPKPVAATPPEFDFVHLAFSVDRTPGRIGLPTCDPWQGWQTQRIEQDLAGGRAPVWLRRSPPNPVLRAADALGLRPRAVAEWIAPLDPWWSLSLLEQEVWWRVVDERLQHGSKGERSAEAVQRREALRAADLRWLAEQTGDPDLVAIADLADLRVEAAGPGPAPLEVVLARLRPGTSQAEREVALNLLCRSGLELDSAEHARLLRALRALDDPSITSRAADLALRSAWNAGRAEQAEIWWSVLREAQASCSGIRAPCVYQDDLAQLEAHRARHNAWSPRDWRESLAAAVDECHELEPLTGELRTSGRWVGGWRFDHHNGPATPFTDCLATHAALPPPTEGWYNVLVTVSGADGP